MSARRLFQSNNSGGKRKGSDRSVALSSLTPLPKKPRSSIALPLNALPPVQSRTASTSLASQTSRSRPTSNVATSTAHLGAKRVVVDNSSSGSSSKAGRLLTKNIENNGSISHPSNSSWSLPLARKVEEENEEDDWDDISDSDHGPSPMKAGQLMTERSLAGSLGSERSTDPQLSSPLLTRSSIGVVASNALSPLLTLSSGSVQYPRAPRNAPMSSGRSSRDFTSIPSTPPPSDHRSAARLAASPLAKDSPVSIPSTQFSYHGGRENNQLSPSIHTGHTSSSAPRSAPSSWFLSPRTGGVVGSSMGPGLSVPVGSGGVLASSSLVANTPTHASGVKPTSRSLVDELDSQSSAEAAVAASPLSSQEQQQQQQHQQQRTGSPLLPYHPLTSDAGSRLSPAVQMESMDDILSISSAGDSQPAIVTTPLRAAPAAQPQTSSALAAASTVAASSPARPLSASFAPRVRSAVAASPARLSTPKQRVTPLKESPLVGATQVQRARRSAPNFMSTPAAQFLPPSSTVDAVKSSSKSGSKPSKGGFGALLARVMSRNRSDIAMSAHVASSPGIAAVGAPPPIFSIRTSPLPAEIRSTVPSSPSPLQGQDKLQVKILAESACFKLQVALCEVIPDGSEQRRASHHLYILFPDQAPSPSSPHALSPGCRVTVHAPWIDVTIGVEPNTQTALLATHYWVVTAPPPPPATVAASPVRPMLLVSSTSPSQFSKKSLPSWASPSKKQSSLAAQAMIAAAAATANATSTSTGSPGDAPAVSPSQADNNYQVQLDIPSGPNAGIGAFAPTQVARDALDAALATQKKKLAFPCPPTPAYWPVTAQASLFSWGPVVVRRVYWHNVPISDPDVLAPLLDFSSSKSVGSVTTGEGSVDVELALPQRPLLVVLQHGTNGGIALLALALVDLRKFWPLIADASKAWTLEGLVQVTSLSLNERCPHHGHGDGPGSEELVPPPIQVGSNVHLPPLDVASVLSNVLCVCSDATSGMAVQTGTSRLASEAGSWRVPVLECGSMTDGKLVEVGPRLGRDVEESQATSEDVDVLQTLEAYLGRGSAVHEFRAATRARGVEPGERVNLVGRVIHVAGPPVSGSRGLIGDYLTVVLSAGMGWNEEIEVFGGIPTTVMTVVGAGSMRTVQTATEYHAVIGFRNVVVGLKPHLGMIFDEWSAVELPGDPGSEIGVVPIVPKRNGLMTLALSNPDVVDMATRVRLTSLDFGSESTWPRLPAGIQTAPAEAETRPGFVKLCVAELTSVKLQPQDEFTCYWLACPDCKAPVLGAKAGSNLSSKGQVGRWSVTGFCASCAEPLTTAELQLSAMVSVETACGQRLDTLVEQDVLFALCRLSSHAGDLFADLAGTLESEVEGSGWPLACFGPLPVSFGEALASTLSQSWALSSSAIGTLFLDPCPSLRASVISVVLPKQ